MVNNPTKCISWSTLVEGQFGKSVRHRGTSTFVQHHDALYEPISSSLIQMPVPIFPKNLCTILIFHFVENEVSSQTKMKLVHKRKTNELYS